MLVYTQTAPKIWALVTVPPVPLTCGMCCTAHRRQMSAGECPPRAQHGGFSGPMRCHLSGTGVQDLQCRSSKQQELHCCYLEQRSHLLQKQGQALHSLPMKTRVGVILPRTTPQLPQPVHDTAATAVAEQLLLCLLLLLLSCCFSSAAALDPPTSGAAMSLYGRLYCTDRAFASARTQRQAAETQDKRVKTVWQSLSARSMSRCCC